MSTRPLDSIAGRAAWRADGIAGLALALALALVWVLGRSETPHAS